MKNGFRVYDSDTHVNPAAEVLERYVDPGFRARLAELEPHRLPVGQGAVGGVEGLHNYRVGTKYYRRVLGEKAPRETFTGRETRWMGSKMPRPGVQDDQAENRVKDMDDEGTDVHFLIPTSTRSGGPPRITICRSPITASRGTRPTIQATRISGKTSSSAGSLPIPGGRCGLSDRSSAAGSSTSIRACAWAFS